MSVSYFPFDQVRQFSKMDVAYATQNDQLKPFFKHNVSLEQFEEVIKEKAQQPIDRKGLVASLQEQYEKAGLAIPKNINRLEERDTYTITTAHQPCLFGGTFYTLYKIASTINLTRQLNKKYPSQHFVPVYWIGGEDHDFEEMNHCTLFSKEIVWQSDQSGPVGRFKLDEGFQKCLSDLSDILGDSPDAKDLYGKIEACYSQRNYGEGTFRFYQMLFEHTELMIINADSSILKRTFQDVLLQELIAPKSKKYIDKVSAELNKSGLKAQAYTRAINLFYLKDGLRERIEKTEQGTWKVLNTAIEFAEKDIIDEVKHHPHHFSPNVNLRPLYQESILPNLAYIGGGGEIAYWLQQKELFEAYEVPYPMLIRRNSGLVVETSLQKKIDKLGLAIKDFFKEEEALVKSYVVSNTSNEVEINDELSQITAAFQSIQDKANAIDISQGKKIGSQLNSIEKQIDQIGSRLIRLEKQRFEVSTNQIRKVHGRLFPKDSLQERKENFLPYLLKRGIVDGVNELIESMNPLDNRVVVISA